MESCLKMVQQIREGGPHRGTEFIRLFDINVSFILSEPNPLEAEMPPVMHRSLVEALVQAQPSGTKLPAALKHAAKFNSIATAHSAGPGL